jgi:cell division protein FtsB
MKIHYSIPSNNLLRVLICSILLVTGLSLSSCFNGRDLAVRKLSNLQTSYEALVKERDALIEENRKLRNDNLLLSKALKEQTIEEYVPAEN